ncbi:hypothetical protein D3C79_833320 [compost metagenome]
MQRLADGHGHVVEVVAGEGDCQLLAQYDAQFQLDIVWPAWEVALGVGQVEINPYRIACFGNSQQLPVATADQAMSRWLSALVHGLHRLRIATQLAKPGPAHRYPGTHGFALLEDGLFA